ncbi:MAG: Nucleoside 5-triphosphatase RdgB (dHAPTP, dITP, XTP-specific), partial [uncultured Nocardioides sp.]
DRCREPRLPGLAQRQEAGRDAAHPGRAGARGRGGRPGRRAGVRRAGGGRARLPGQRPAQGPGGARGDRPAVAGRRQRTVRRRPQRHAGRAVRAVVGSARCRQATGRRPQQRTAAPPARRRARRAPECPLRVRGGVLPPRRHRAGGARPDGRPGAARGPWQRRLRLRRAVRRRRPPGDHGRARRRRQGRDLTPRQGVARDRASGGCGARCRL